MVLRHTMKFIKAATACMVVALRQFPFIPSTVCSSYNLNDVELLRHTVRFVRPANARMVVAFRSFSFSTSTDSAGSAFSACSPLVSPCSTASRESSACMCQIYTIFGTSNCTIGRLYSVCSRFVRPLQQHRR